MYVYIYIYIDIYQPLLTLIGEGGSIKSQINQLFLFRSETELTFFKYK